MKTTINARIERSRSFALKTATFTALLLLTASAATAGEAERWTPLVNRPAINNVQLMILMTDGSVMVHTYDDIQTWVKLTPDAKGSYINGTWETLGKMITPRLYFASQVLQNGKLWVMGGEFTGPFQDPNIGSEAEIYDPLSNSWSAAASYPPQPGCGRRPVTSNVSLTTGSTAVGGIYSTSRILPGWTVAGAGIPANTTVVTVDSPTSVTLSAKATASGPAVARFVGVPASCFGDDPSALVPGNKILLGNIFTPQTFLYSIADNAFTPSGTKVNNDRSDEEGWAAFSRTEILNYDLFQSIKMNTGFAEKYTPATGTWTSISPADGTARGTLPILSDAQVGFELGPIVRVPDGRVLVIGANQHTALYSPALNKWEAGPDLLADLTGPGGTIANAPFGADDAPAAVLPNGHVILAADAGPNPITLGAGTNAGTASITLPTTAGLQLAWPVAQADGKHTTIPRNAQILSVDSPTSITLGTTDASGNVVPVNALQTQPNAQLVFGGIFNPPALLFDFNPHTGTLKTIAGPPGSLLPIAPSFVTRMLMLPTGQLLFSDSSNQLYVYTPKGSAPESLRPEITDVDYTGYGVFKLTGRRINGQSAGASYGDDDQMNENYPIIRLENRDGDVFYCRTTNWDSVGVGGDRRETVDFTLNPAVTPGRYELTVVGAGIASRPVRLRIRDDELTEYGAENRAATAQLPAGSSALAKGPLKPTQIPKPYHPQP